MKTQVPDRSGQAILVTGASGRVGSAVLSHLRHSRPIVAGSRRPLPAFPDVRTVAFDITDAATFEGTLAGVDTIFLMRPPQIADARVFRPFLERAQAAGIRRVLVLSVLGADSNPILPHHGIERLVMEMGFDWTMIRPSDFMQNLETVHLAGIRERSEIAVPAGGGKSAFIDVDDIGAAVARILSGEGHVGKGYALTGPEALDFDQVAATLTTVLGRTIRYRRVGPLRFLAEKLGAGEPLGLSLVMVALYTVQRLGKAATLTPDLQALIGRAPTPIEEYLEKNRGLFG